MTQDVDTTTMLCDLADEMIGQGESFLSCEYGIYTGEEIEVTVTIKKKQIENSVSELDAWL